MAVHHRLAWSGRRRQADNAGFATARRGRRRSQEARRNGNRDDEYRSRGKEQQRSFHDASLAAMSHRVLQIRARDPQRVGVIIGLVYEASKAGLSSGIAGGPAAE
jgi:hypothetical protein